MYTRANISDMCTPVHIRTQCMHNEHTAHTYYYSHTNGFISLHQRRPDVCPIDHRQLKLIWAAGGCELLAPHNATHDQPFRRWIEADKGGAPPTAGPCYPVGDIDVCDLCTSIGIHTDGKAVGCVV